MSIGTVGKLYSPDLLALATSLSRFPLTDDLPLRAQQFSRTCGSKVDLGLAADAEGRIARLGLRVSACAVGQASAALFAQAARGKSRDDMYLMLGRIESWLKDGGAPPDWPDLALLQPAVPLASRHSALLLPWKAACDALSKVPTCG